VQASTVSAALKNYVCLKKVGKSVRTWDQYSIGIDHSGGEMSTQRGP
jgi:hypothetical protein